MLLNRSKMIFFKSHPLKLVEVYFRAAKSIYTHRIKLNPSCCAVPSARFKKQKCKQSSVGLLLNFVFNYYFASMNSNIEKTF